MAISAIRFGGSSSARLSSFVYVNPSNRCFILSLAYQEEPGYRPVVSVLDCLITSDGTSTVLSQHTGRFEAFAERGVSSIEDVKLCSFSVQSWDHLLNLSAESGGRLVIFFTLSGDLVAFLISSTLASRSCYIQTTQSEFSGARSGTMFHCLSEELVSSEGELSHFCLVRNEVLFGNVVLQRRTF
ncbi:MAG: 20 kDa unknown protein [Plant associated closterovirus 1]|nr:MAG: 20 kDa unknown protein [Plant associated closterovirus 1]